jgi:hypothetical protein
MSLVGTDLRESGLTRRGTKLCSSEKAFSAAMGENPTRIITNKA